MATKKNTAKTKTTVAEQATVKDETKTSAKATKAQETTTAPKALKKGSTATKSAKAKKTSSKTIAEQLAKAKEQVNDSNSTGGAINIEQAETEDVLNEYSPQAQEFIKNGTVVAQEANAQDSEKEELKQELEQEKEPEQPVQATVEPENRGKGRPKSNIKKKKILIYLPEELVERLDKIVQEAGQSRVGYIQRAVTTAVKLSEKE